MNRIYVLLCAAVLSTALFSCEDKSASDQLQDTTHTGTDVTNKAEDVKEDVREESQKTTKNGSDAH